MAGNENGIPEGWFKIRPIGRECGPLRRLKTARVCFPAPEILSVSISARVLTGQHGNRGATDGETPLHGDAMQESGDFRQVARRPVTVSASRKVTAGGDVATISVESGAMP